MTTAEDRITALEAAVEALVDQLQNAPALAAAPSPPAPPPPERRAAPADTADWTELMDWVDGLTADYSLFGDYPILPCWPAHPAWSRNWPRSGGPGWSTPTPSPGRLDGSLTAWHDQWLWPCLNRVKAGHYTISGCRQHHEPGRAHRALTDRFIVGP